MIAWQQGIIICKSGFDHWNVRLECDSECGYGFLVTYFLTQLFSGHGFFRSFIRLKMGDTYGAMRGDAYHTCFTCNQFVVTGRILTHSIDYSTPETILGAMLGIGRERRRSRHMLKLCSTPKIKDRFVLTSRNEEVMELQDRLR